jgi:ATPase family associated with various cellular activities (AAA)
MHPNLIVETLEARMNAHMAGVVMRPLFIRGAPGGGKTQTVEYVAQKMGIGYSHVHGPTQLAEDFGVPIPTPEGALKFAVPEDKFPFVGSNHFPEEFGLINIDEMAAMGNDQQKIMANMIQQRENHGRKLKPGWMFVATGNRQEDRAGANRILSHLNDRYTTIDYEMKTDDWIEWALTRGKVDPRVVAFLQWRSDLLAPAFDPNADKNATPRGWAEGVSPSLSCTPRAALFESIKGDVGEGPAVEFMAFNETYLSLPDPDLVLAKPSTFHVPDEAHILYALIGALVARVDETTFPALIIYAQRMPPEFMVMLMRNVITAHGQLTQTDAFTNWAGTSGAKALFAR